MATVAVALQQLLAQKRYPVVQTLAAQPRTVRRYQPNYYQRGWSVCLQQRVRNAIEAARVRQ